MATGLEIVGGIATIAELPGTIFKICRRLRRCKNALSHAKGEINRVHHALSDFGRFLEIFCEVESNATKVGCGLPEKLQSRGLMQRLILSCQADLARVRCILRNVEPLRSDKAHSLIQRSWAAMKWHFEQGDVNKACVAIESNKLSLNLMIALVNWSSLVQRNTDLEQAGKTVRPDLRKTW